MEPDLPPEEHPLGFQTEVEIQLEHMKEFPVLDDTARLEDERVRRLERLKRRKEIRRYKGPPIETEEARVARDKRKKDLRTFYNREDAKRTKIMAAANSAYQKWLNTVLTNMANNAEKESFDVANDCVNLRNKIKEIVIWRDSIIITREITGYGNTVE